MQYRNTVFTSLFNDKARLLELYNAIEGTSYADPDIININTLQDALIMGKINDVSFTIDNKLVVLIEHQSSVNENMPLRCLLYIAKIYERMASGKAIYKEKLLKIPTPEFIVLYNGVAEYPKEKTLKLSDAFEAVGHSGQLLESRPVLELVVKILNINKGRNPGLEHGSATLSGYSTFIDKVREFERGDTLDNAVRKAVGYCIENGILRDYLERNKSEVINMLFTEFNMDDALSVRYEEGVSQGISQGISQGVSQGKAEERSHLKDLLKQGLSADEILKRLG